MRIAKQEIPVRIGAPGDRQEAVNGGDLYYWPPGHTVKVGADAEVILLSPQHEHGEVIDHMRRQMGA